MASSSEWLRNVFRPGCKIEPRRAMHSLKVGMALALSSLTVLQETLFKQLGGNAIWAVMTVVVVFELTAGATVCKGSNRAFGTLLAGTLALGVEYLADLAGPTGEPYIVGFSVFLIGTLATYTRFCEPFKSKYDYGVMIFLLTFSLIIVSGYRVSNNMDLAVSRFLNIVLGGVICLVMTMLIKPIWASEDLHNIIRTNFDNLATSLEGIMNAYFKEVGKYQPPLSCEDDPIYDCYKAVLVSKPTEESLAHFASWEPRWKSCYSNKGVWNQYVQVGGMLRSCTYIVASLHGCLISNVQASFTLRNHVSNACQDVAMGFIVLLRELGENLQRKERSRSKEDLLTVLLDNVENLKQVMDQLNGKHFSSPYDDNKQLVLIPINVEASHKRRLSFEDQVIKEASHKGSISFEDKANVIYGGKDHFGGTLAIATIGFLLIELVSRVDHLVDAQKVLESLANFRIPKVNCERPNISIVRSIHLDSLSIQGAE